MASTSVQPAVIEEAPSATRALNIQLMRVVLRTGVQDEYDREEARLWEMFLERYHFPDPDEQQEVMLRLLTRIRSGRMTGFSARYVRFTRHDFHRSQMCAKRRNTDGEDQTDLAPDHRELSPEAITELREIEMQFRATQTDEIDRALFDAWIASGNKQGWQREFARDHGKKDNWVTRRLGQFRKALKKQHDIDNADAFVELLAQLRETDDDMPDAWPAEEGASNTDEVEDDRIHLLRQRLQQSSAADSPEGRLIFDYLSGAPRDEIRENHPNEVSLLGLLHERYIQLGRELASELNGTEEAPDHA